MVETPENSTPGSSPENPTFWTRFGPETAAAFFAIGAALIDTIVYEGYQKGIVDPRRGLDVVNFMAGGAVFATHARLIMQLAYIGEVRGVYRDLGKRYPEFFVNASNLSSNLPLF